jgi:hypothetical protein
MSKEITADQLDKMWDSFREIATIGEPGMPEGWIKSLWKGEVTEWTECFIAEGETVRDKNAIIEFVVESVEETLCSGAAPRYSYFEVEIADQGYTCGDEAREWVEDLVDETIRDLQA